MEWRFWTGPLCNTVFRNSHHDRSHNFGGYFLYRNGFFFKKERYLQFFIGYSWNTIGSLGQHCPNLMRFRLTIWATDELEDAETFELENNRSETVSEPLRRRHNECQFPPDFHLFWMCPSAAWIPPPPPAQSRLPWCCPCWAAHPAPSARRSSRRPCHGCGRSTCRHCAALGYWTGCRCWSWQTPVRWRRCRWGWTAWRSCWSTVLSCARWEA